VTTRPIVAFSSRSHRDLRSILQASAEAAVRHLDAAFAHIWTLNDQQNQLELQASAGRYSRVLGTDRKYCAKWNAETTRRSKCLEKSYRSAKPMPIERTGFAIETGLEHMDMFTGAGKQRTVTQALTDFLRKPVSYPPKLVLLPWRSVSL
jgi:hypothetical protein